MKLVMMVALMFAAQAAISDCRIEIDNGGANTAHVPYKDQSDGGNTDDETKIFPEQAHSIQIDSEDVTTNGYLWDDGVETIVESDGGGLYYGWARLETWTPGKQVTVLGLTEKGQVLQTSDNSSGETCTLEVDGTSYTCPDWKAITRLDSNLNEWGGGTVVFRVEANDCTQDN